MGDLAGMLQSGGPIVWLLIVLSVFSLMLICVKTLALRGVLGGELKRAAAFEQWSGGDKTAAMRAMDPAPTPADRITLAAMEGLAANKPRPVLTGDLEWRGNAEVATMNRHIRILELIAMISPLLGLLGTVLGMIQSFQELALAEGAANASLLAAGIWQALLTTAAGLLVAIPAAIAASLLTEKVERAAGLMETAIGQLFAIEDAR